MDWAEHVVLPFRRLLPPLLAFIAFILVPGMASARAPRYQPDGLIKRAGDANYLGWHIWNTTAAGQTRNVSVLAGSTVTFDLQFQNDGRQSDRFRIHGCATGNGLTIRYFHGHSDVTSSVVSGSYKTPMLAPGALSSLKLKATTGTNFASTVACQVAATSSAAPTRKDVVAVSVYTQA